MSVLPSPLSLAVPTIAVPTIGIPTSAVPSFATLAPVGALLDVAGRAVGVLAAAAYALVPSPAGAVALVTLAVGAAVAPLLVRAARAGRRRAALGPALAALRAEHAADPSLPPAELQAAIVALHRQHDVPLLGGLGATVVQGAAFAVLLHSLRGIFHRTAGTLAPGLLPSGSALRSALAGAATVPWLGADLAASGWAAVAHGPAGGAVFVGLALVVGGLAHLQQRVARRDAASLGEVPAGPPALRRIVPVLTWSWLLVGLTVPLAVSVSVATSSAVRLVATLVAHRHPVPPL